MYVPPSSAAAELVLLERGWLSSNNVLLRDGEAGTALLFDSGHVSHAEQTLALVHQALGGLALGRLVNTHLHSDHCGGNARLQAAHDALQLLVPPGQAQAVRDWDVGLLGYRPTGQLCPRFHIDGVVQPGELLRCGRWCFEALAAPGHDPHALVYFDAGSGVLLSGDALWRDG
jgi:glyoxylase-like metal-dependent hydrolase (beta-lactamase superfamily II)